MKKQTLTSVQIEKDIIDALKTLPKNRGVGGYGIRACVQARAIAGQGIYVTKKTFMDLSSHKGLYLFSVLPSK